MRQREAQPGRRTIVEDIEREAVEPDHLGEAADRSGEIVEAVGELVARRQRGAAEARKVGRDHVEPVREQRDEVAEHVARGGEAVQQQKRRRIRAAGFAIEDLEAVDSDGAVGRDRHRTTPLIRADGAARLDGMVM